MPLSFKRTFLIGLLLLGVFSIGPVSNIHPFTGTSAARAASIDHQISRLRVDINRLMKTGRNAEALAKAKRYRVLMQKRYGSRHPQYAGALDLLAKVYRKLKRPRTARRYAASAAKIRRTYRNLQAKRKTNLKTAQMRARKRKAEAAAKAHRKKLQKERLARARQLQLKKPKQKGKTVTALKVPSTSARRTRSAITSRPAKPRLVKPQAPKPQISKQPAKRQVFKHQPVQKKSPGSSARLRSGSQPKTMTRGISSRNRNARPAPIIVPPAPENRIAAAEAPPAALAEAPAPAAPALNQDENFARVKVFYATDRKRTNSMKLASFFSGEASEPKEISYGLCEVSIPKGHEPGELEAPSIWRFEFKEDPEKHVVLLKVEPLDKDVYFTSLKKVIDKTKGKNAFIFVHGYNVTFKDAARRTAQIAFDLQFDGAPVFYSWPSKGTLDGYTADEDVINWAQANLKVFLKDFVTRTEAENIYLIAHSMGNRALTGAVSALISENADFKKRFREIILAAPDISARTFRDVIAPKMVEASNNVTLYVSSDDKALLASRQFHRGSPRAGEAGDDMIIHEGIDTIDATGLDASLLAHTYFAETRSIITDLLNIIRHGYRPPKRKTLRPVITSRGTYWTFSEAKIAQ